MEIQNNIIRHHLRNVYFVCGTACGGKTTMSRLLAEKYGFALYDMDEMYPQHRAIADPQHQPDTCYHMQDFHEQWMRPPEEQARWNISSIREQSEMVLLDLITFAQNQPVVADVLYSPLYTPEIISYNKIIFLTVNRQVLRAQYFNRPEKKSFYEFVRSKPMAEVYFENILTGLEQTNDLEQQMMSQSGFKMIERNPKAGQDELLAQIEAHFGLSGKPAQQTENRF